MSYSNSRFDVRYIQPVALARSLGTATASGDDDFDLSGADSLVKCPKFWRRSVVNKARMIVTTIPSDAAVALQAHFLNGTDTFGVVTLTTATLGQVFDVTLDTAYNTFTASAQPTIKTTGTSTASADAAGSYNVFFEVQELFS